MASKQNISRCKISVLQVNYESESDSETTSGGGGCKSGAADDGGGLVDVEDIGVVMGKAKESTDTVCSSDIFSCFSLYFVCIV